MKKLKYILFMIPLLFGFINNVKADMFEPTSALQYYEYYVNGSFREASFNYGQNIELASPTTINYPYAISLILYGNYKSGDTYTIKTNVSTYFETDYFKFYYDHLDYLIMNSQVTFGSKKSFCNLNPIIQNSSYSISCTFTPEADLSQIVIGLVNQDWQNNGYVPFGASDYVRFTDYTGLVYDNSSDVIIDQNQTIIDQNNQTNQELSDLNDSLNDSDTSDATNEAGNFFSGFETNTFGLTSIITAPLDLIASITSSSCSPLGLQVPFVDNVTLNLPCMSTIYQKHFGSFLSVYQTITFGIVAYWVCVRIFALVKDFKNPDHDEIEVLDL